MAAAAANSMIHHLHCRPQPDPIASSEMKLKKWWERKSSERRWNRKWGLLGGEAPAVMNRRPLAPLGKTEWRESASVSSSHALCARWMVNHLHPFIHQNLQDLFKHWVSKQCLLLALISCFFFFTSSIHLPLSLYWTMCGLATPWLAADRAVSGSVCMQKDSMRLFCWGWAAGWNSAQWHGVQSWS